MHDQHREGQGERAERIPATLPCPSQPSAVGFDIETTGVGPDDIVTVACAWSPTCQAHCFHGEDFSEVERMLDSADRIYTFNGIEFDLPRFAKHCGRSMQLWCRKTVDPHYVMKHTMGLGACSKLNELLRENGLEPKSGSGMQAIQLWNDGHRQALLEYCMDDSRLTYLLCQIKEIRWKQRWLVRLAEAKVLDFLDEQTQV